MTIDSAIRVYDGLNQISASLSNTASSAALIHPNGCLHQYNSRVDVMTVDGMARNSYVYSISCFQPRRTETFIELFVLQALRENVV